MPTSTEIQLQHHNSSSPSPMRSVSKKTMSITQTYFLAHKARAKLSREAAQADHNLRLLVGHANLLDTLMLELADAEREQELWFNQSVRGARKPAGRRVQWADEIVEQPEEEYGSDSSDSDFDSDLDDDDVDITNTVSARTSTSSTTPVVSVSQVEMEEEEEEEEMTDDDLEDDYAQLELVRTPSHSGSPPELVDHDSESSDDESLPPSPTDASLEYNDKEGKDHTEEIFQDEFYDSREASRGLISAISVY